MAIENTLRGLEKLLPDLNYVVFFHLQRLPFSPEKTLDEYLNQILPEAVIGGRVITPKKEMLEEVESALRYNGDSRRVARNEKKFEIFASELLSYLDEVASRSFRITNVWIKNGHPNYPVFWEFAYIFTGLHGVEIFIGSSSD